MSSGVKPPPPPAFQEQQLHRVRAYVEAVCAPDRCEEAVSAAFIDFMARGGGEADLELLRATRSAAASRFLVLVPQGMPGLSLTPECRAMPELLALHAGRERQGDEALIAAHLSGCAVCAHTLDRMQEAERAFGRGAGELPALDLEATTVDMAKFPARRVRPPATPRRAAAEPSSGSAAPEPNPLPEPEDVSANRVAGSPPALDPGGTERRRSGGLVGSIRKLRGPPRE